MAVIAIRRVLPDDSLEELTGMLRWAFAPPGHCGLNCSCVDQTVDVTPQRLRLGDCFVAVIEGRIVGTITLHAVDHASPVRWYRKPTVASIHQLAVDPHHQGTGVGHALLRKAEAWARSRQYLELALDTPEPAQHLHLYCGIHGFRRMDTAQLEGKFYRSVVLSKSIACPVRRLGSHAWPAGDPASRALLTHAAPSGRPRSVPSVGSMSTAITG